MYVFRIEHAITHADSDIAQPFTRDSSEIAGLFANQGLFVSFHTKGGGNITPIAQDIEIHWSSDCPCISELKAYAPFKLFTVYDFLLLSRQIGNQEPPAT